MPTDVAAARRRYEAERERFRAAAVAAVVDEGQRKTDVAADAGISRPALDSWIKDDRRAREQG